MNKLHNIIYFAEISHWDQELLSHMLNPLRTQLLNQFRFPDINTMKNILQNQVITPHTIYHSKFYALFLFYYEKDLKYLDDPADR